VSARVALVGGLLCLALAHVVALVAWPSRPAAAHAELVAADENLGEVFVELEPGEFAGTLMLGGLRGLVIDLLWLRASSAKEDGRFYESVAVFDLISKVQPRFEQVWEYMAHDLAYNIAVEVHEPDQWAWYLAGLDAINRGARRNPQSTHLLRYHAWMFQHRGERVMERVEHHDWSQLVNPILLRYPEAVRPVAEGTARRGGDGELHVELAVGRLELGASVLLFADGGPPVRARVVGFDDAGPLLEAESGSAAADRYRVVESLSNYQLAYRMYAAVDALAARVDERVPAHIRRLMAIGIERDGNRLRNRGRHLDALRRYLDGLAEWQEIMAWAEDPYARQEPQAISSTRMSYERNEGRLRRRAAQLARELAPDPVTAHVVEEAIMRRDVLAARMLLHLDGWSQRALGAGGVQWYDRAAVSGRDE